jgi:hypothetical protein
MSELLWLIVLAQMAMAQRSIVGGNDSQAT